MLALAVIAATLLVPAQEGRADLPDREEIERAVRELDEAFDDGDAAARIRALERATDVVDAEVIALVAAGLKDRDPAVAAQAIESLRFMDHPDALSALHKAAARDRRIRKDDELLAKLLKAIGQHGSEESIPVLTDDLFANPSRAVVQARILGLGRIRSRESVETLINLMNRSSARKADPYMGEMRLALLVLTGVDRGKSRDAWMRWWNDNKRGLEVAAKQPPIPREQQNRWDGYWGNPRREVRPVKRGERGGD